MILHGIKYYHIITYGCQMNAADSETLGDQLESLGYISTDDPAAANVILLNTCCVRESAENKVYGKLGELKHLKNGATQPIIGVCGCMAQKEQDKLLARAPHVNFVAGPNNINRVAAIITEILHRPHPIVAVNEARTAVPTPATIRQDVPISAWLPIMYGCNNFCTYCIVPYVRGRERSRPLPDIVRTAAAWGEKGCREITLLGQNVNSYGHDRCDGTDFASLLRALDDIDTLYRIRFLTSHPRDMTADVIDAIRTGRHICEHIHLPVQSGSDTILAKMNRGYTTAHYKLLLQRLRQEIPNVSITTDIIVGFPGETDDLFAETLAFVDEMRFDAAFTFMYSPRSGTPAATMPGQVSPAVKKQRLRALMDVQNWHSLAINRSLVGQTWEVLVEGPSKNDATKLTGRTRTNKIVIWDNNGAQPGSLLNIAITKAQTWLLKGTPATAGGTHR